MYYISIKSDKFKTKTNTIIAGVCRDTMTLPPFGEGCSPQYGKITILSPSDEGAGVRWTPLQSRSTDRDGGAACPTQRGCCKLKKTFCL